MADRGKPDSRPWDRAILPDITADLARPDMSAPDAPVPDAPVPDAPIPDAPAPDMAPPDMPAVDTTVYKDAYICSPANCSAPPTGLKCCNNACVWTEKEPNHCGGCGNVCSSGTCCDGKCCSSGQICCLLYGSGMQYCADPKTDSLNCGYCGNKCHNWCSNGVCAP